MGWHKELTQGFHTPQALLAYLQLPASMLPATLAANQLFSTRVPLSFAKRMQKGTLNDPLLKQVLPARDEEKNHADYVTDPLQERSANPISGLLHKYHGRALMIVAGSCAINCRYCFRRHFNYQDNQLARHDWQRVVDYFCQDKTLTEIILSGGDPLMLKDSVFSALLDTLCTIPQLTTIRIHSRLPVVIPSRITHHLLNALHQTNKRIVLVIHSNHPNEINDEVKAALAPLLTQKITCLNQSVLLKGINDNPGILAQLSHALFDAGVLPYYLHLPDKVRGTQHFDVEQKRACDIHHQLQSLLPGYLVPKLVAEVPGKRSKITLS